VPGLDSRDIQEKLFQEGRDAREKRVFDLNHLEPVFPYKVMPLIPGLYGLDSLPDTDVLGPVRRVKI
jgi:hypothetical protein